MGTTYTIANAPKADVELDESSNKFDLLFFFEDGEDTSRAAEVLEDMGIVSAGKLSPEEVESMILRMVYVLGCWTDKEELEARLICNIHNVLG